MAAPLETITLITYAFHGIHLTISYDEKTDPANPMLQLIRAINVEP